MQCGIFTIGDRTSHPVLKTTPTNGPWLEDFSDMTPLTAGSPQQVIERTSSFQGIVGDYQRRVLFIDHAGLPLKTVLEQLDIFDAEVLPMLRREFSARKPDDVPEAPTHDWLVARRLAGTDPVPVCFRGTGCRLAGAPQCG